MSELVTYVFGRNVSVPEFSLVVDNLEQLAQVVDLVDECFLFGFVHVDLFLKNSIKAVKRLKSGGESAESNII